MALSPVVDMLMRTNVGAAISSHKLCRRDLYGSSAGTAASGGTTAAAGTADFKPPAAWLECWGFSSTPPIEHAAGWGAAVSLASVSSPRVPRQAILEVEFFASIGMT